MIVRKLMLITLLPVLLIWAVGFYASITSQNSLQETIEASSIARASATIGEIDRMMQSQIIFWRVYNQNDHVQQALANSNEQFAALPDVQQHIDQMDEQWRRDSHNDASPLINSLIKKPLSKNLRVRLQELEQSAGYPVYGEVFLTNRYGANVAQTNPTSDFRQDDEAWWREAAARGVYVGDLDYDESAGVYSMAICLRVDGEDGELAGVMKAVLNIESVAAIMRSRSLINNQNDPYTTLFTADNQIIWSDRGGVKHHSDGGGYLRGVSMTGESFATVSERTDPLQKQKLLSIYARAGADDPGQVAGLGWTLLLDYDAEQVFAPVTKLRYNILLSAAVMTVVSLLFSGRVAMSLSRRVKQLSDATARLGRGDLDTAIDNCDDDEIGRLGECFNQMVQDLKRVHDERESMHSQLAETSRRAGMAEVATGVLHNVGNVLNSVNISAGLLTKQFHRSDFTQLAKASELIKAHLDDLPGYIQHDERGKHLPAFLLGVTEKLAREHENIAEELNTLCGNIAHMKEVVAAQQNYAKATESVDEHMAITEVIETALKINKAGLDRHGIEVIRDYQDVPPFRIDKLAVLHTLVNLISNAKYALSGSPEPRRLTLRVRRSADKPPKVCVQVIDNGVGIGPEHLEKVFQHGFTTRSDGHGFGLHTSALSATEMRGSLTAQSDGRGHGATFTLEIPIKTPIGSYVPKSGQEAAA